MSRLDGVRQFTLETLTDIVESERAFKAKFGVDISNPDDWMELRDIIARIERKLATKQAAE